MKNRKIVIITFYAFPSSNIGAKRMSLFANYLANRNIDVEIIKADNSKYESIDSNLKLHNAVKIHNITTRSKSRGIYSSIILSLKYFKYISKYFSPNECIFICSGGPFFYFSTMYYLNKIDKRYQYILDYRDLWNLDYTKQLNFKGLILQKFFWHQEKHIVNKSSQVITVTQGCKDIIEENIKSLEDNKVIVIRNGYDENYELNTEKLNEDKFKIGIFGKFSYYNNNDVDILVNSMKKLSKSFEVMHIGEIEEYFLEQIKKHGLQDRVSFKGYMSYNEAMKELESCRILITNNRDSRALGSKIFDYILLDKPIFAFIAKKSEIAELIAEFENSYLIDNCSTFVRSVENVIEQKQTNLGIKNKQRFSREFSFQKFYSVLSERLC